MKNKKENVEGGTPVKSGPDHDQRHEDDSKKSPKKVKDDAINNSEKDNMNGQKGYYEIPQDVPVKSVDRKAN
ncbi:hypothetical protein [Dyadobacter sp. CY312]|uniref:hypothetical protein n=1 Tax=Dyadobacter sp. CY312 TaxID=2907303 RepID=UPI001F3CDA7E|nr:hypothetical protein [Dyadobacter sp. CY312]MCE7040191.1 hypothetical protein [Dyadobacter sp. CY312]